ncbi:SDR family oxidoreductase [Aspergillus lucknowensis]|uniref:NAD(P)-binding protein n=1 Tax=Aspergillus lucknowensis TaxID=176173 RepID=A0ABR4LCR2_9EURO
MPSYAITGASRGIGWGLLENVSSNPQNTVIALVRNKPGTEDRVAKELPGRSNIHVLQADLDDYKSLEAAAADTAEITGGALDVLIANAARISLYDVFDPIGVLGENPTVLEENLVAKFKTNAVAQIHLFNLFIPLLLRGTLKKAIAISSGHGDIDFVNNEDIATSACYAISKVALNMAVAKFNVQYKAQGVLFMSISPGMVDTGHIDPEKLTPEQGAAIAEMLRKFKTYAPDLERPMTPAESAKLVLPLIENATVEKNGGGFISHKGNRIWL